MTMDDYKVSITKVSEENTFDQNGRQVQNMRVDYMIGKHGPFSDRFLKSTFDANAARAELEKRAAAMRMLMA